MKELKELKNFVLHKIAKKYLFCTALFATMSNVYILSDTELLTCTALSATTSILSGIDSLTCTALSATTSILSGKDLAGPAMSFYLTVGWWCICVFTK